MQRRLNIAKAFINLNKAVMEASAVSKALIRDAASHAAGCRYCRAHTIRAAQRYGEPDEKLERVWEYPHSTLYNDAERAALDFALAAASRELCDHFRGEEPFEERIESIGGR